MAAALGEDNWRVLPEILQSEHWCLPRLDGIAREYPDRAGAAGTWRYRGFSVNLPGGGWALDSNTGIGPAAFESDESEFCTAPGPCVPIPRSGAAHESEPDRVPLLRQYPHAAGNDCRFRSVEIRAAFDDVEDMSVVPTQFSPA
jgi:hypothetical protein